MDTYVGCRIVEYFFIVYCSSIGDFGPICECGFFLLININRPYGATYCQTVYVPKYLPRARVVSGIVGSCVSEGVRVGAWARACPIPH